MLVATIDFIVDKMTQSLDASEIYIKKNMIPWYIPQEGVDLFIHHDLHSEEFNAFQAAIGSRKYTIWSF